MSTYLTRSLRAAGAPVRGILVGLISVYRMTIGRLAAGRCRFHPSCSAYAIEAIRLHGAVKGGGLALWRLLRCSPLTLGGPDPVPPARQASRERVTAGGRMTASYEGSELMTRSYGKP